jgi:hypothetical protein
MNISHKLITLGLALSLLGSTSAFARPTPHFENGCLSCKNKKETVESHAPTATCGATAYAHRPSASTTKDDWPDNMILG